MAIAALITFSGLPVRRSLAAKNDLAYAFYWRGQAYHRRKQIARMVDDYQAFLTLQPEAPEAPALKVLLGSLR